MSATIHNNTILRMVQPYRNEFLEELLHVISNQPENHETVVGAAACLAFIGIREDDLPKYAEKLGFNGGTFKHMLEGSLTMTDNQCTHFIESVVDDLAKHQKVA